jgi:hypothetical protein
MPSAQKVQLQNHLVETFSTLTSSQKREVIDFADFIAKRGWPTKSVKRATGSLEALFDIATECKDTDLSTRHDEYLFTDLCGTLSWKGDAVAAQRSLRDEW